MPIELTDEDYSALVYLARAGSTDKTALEAFLRDVERRNGIQRYFLMVQWQEADQPLPPTTRFPESWPPTLRKYIELVGRPVTKADVQDLLSKEAVKPVTVLVTKDPNGLVGWTELDVYFGALRRTDRTYSRLERAYSCTRRSARSANPMLEVGTWWVFREAAPDVRAWYLHRYTKSVARRGLLRGAW